MPNLVYLACQIAGNCSFIQTKSQIDGQDSMDSTTAACYTCTKLVYPILSIFNGRRVYE